MTNGEKYSDEIKKLQSYDKPKGSFCEEFVRPKILKRSCKGLMCEYYILIQALWLNEEYKEPEVDWSKVPVDTKVFVRNLEDGLWRPRHFAKY